MCYKLCPPSLLAYPYVFSMLIIYKLYTLQTMIRKWGHSTGSNKIGYYGRGAIPTLSINVFRLLTPEAVY